MHMNRLNKDDDTPPMTAVSTSVFQALREDSCALTAPLSAEDCQVQSMPDTSPAKWHLAHTTWFFETFVLERFEPNFKPFDAQFRVLFNSYYNAVGDKHPRPERGLLTRPSLERVMAYRQQVDERMSMLLHTQSSLAALQWIVTLGLHHEQQHQELILTDIKHALASNPLLPAYQTQWPLTRVSAQAPQWVTHEGGVHTIGHAGDAFAFDNETPAHHSYLHPYQLSSQLVTHGQWRDFIADGGYTRPELWLSLGWDWVQATQAQAPLYWRNLGGSESAADWHTFTLQGLVRIDEHTPICHINYVEADAYCRWIGARLPTEMEWEHAARGLPTQERIKGNLREANHRQALHPMPLAHTFTGHEQQLFGDVWEWTSSSYAPYPGYQPWSGAAGEYNGKFMCNQYVLRGGSCVTPASHIRASYRNFFPPLAQWQFSGLRLARDAQ
jgi:ergothioneine biosynthesis protein EgtB